MSVKNGARTLIYDTGFRNIKKELVHMSCNIDEYIYGNLPGLEFKRTGTLGIGADKCDFCLRRIR